MSIRLTKAETEEDLMALFLFLGTVIAGFTLGQVLYDAVHRIVPRVTSWPDWLLIMFMVASLSCAPLFRILALRCLFIALAVNFAIKLWVLIQGPGLVLWLVDNGFSLFVGAVSVAVGLRRNRPIGRIAALLLGLAAIAGRYVILEKLA